MLFNSINFAIFLPLVFILYWFVVNKNLKAQNILLLVASYVFYAFWDWRFLFLLVFSTVLDYYTGIKMSDAKSDSTKKIWLWISISINLGFLGVFKYYNFFAESFTAALSNFGWYVDPFTIQVILPVGISFYTFHGLSYVIDIYKDRIKAEKSYIDYAVFVSFFPLLVAGPIERATHLLPQIKKKRTFSYDKAIDGIYQIIWGLFKKIVIADSCAQYVNAIFKHPDDMNSLSLFMGAFYFAFQIYGDFSGYSDIALGTAKLFGIDLLRNFNFPYFSRDIAEFWRRWHISLSSWFRDYLYIPLGGSKGGNWMKVRNTFIIFIVSGFWHGANWTFIVWGTLNACYFMPLLLTNSNRNNLEIVAKGKILPSIRELFSMVLTFLLVLVSWIFFRADTIVIAVKYIRRMFAFNFENGLEYFMERYSIELVLLVSFFVFFEWISREKEHPFFGKWLNVKLTIILLSIIIFGAYSNNADFIYFQF